MSPEHWQRIDRLFDEALDLPPDERTAFLERACDGDTALREEVEALLTACENATGFLDQPPISLAETALSPFFEVPEDDLAPGQTLGPYRIIEPIGRGGMGAVYLAKRDDGHFQKRVALKVVKRGMDTDEIVGRFRYERQILARLEHEGIARLLDGGITQDGRPYFVMECVDGEPLDDYCDRMRLSVPERLALFMDVLEAVRYAHHNLVVHRDLKPSNILVAPPDEEGGRPQVKLLDFGIAKLLDTDAATTIPLTEAHTRRLTPDYAAPEQIRGEPPTPATDVYALGIILYELLTGRRPYHFPTRSLSEIEQTICERAPHKPSTAIFHARLAPPSADDTPPTASTLAAQRRTLPKKLHRTLAGDLDAIILKALRKEPERRYASAAELLRDLCRYTEGKTVYARPDTFRYRTSRFVRQHKVGVAATALIMLTLVAGIVATTREARRATRAFQAQEVEAAKKSATLDVLISTFEVVDPEAAQGEPVTTDDIIKNGLSQVELLRDQPEIQVSVINAIGKLSLSVGKYELADSLFRASLAAQDIAQDVSPLEAAEARYGLAEALKMQRRFEESEQWHREALALRRQELGLTHPDLIKYLNGLASALYTQYTQGFQEKGMESEALYRQALAIGSEKLDGPHPDVAESLDGLANLLDAQGHLSEAETFYRRALKIQRQVLRSTHPRIAETMYNLAETLRSQGKLDQAERLHRQALERFRSVYGEQHQKVGNSYYTLAFLLHQAGDYTEAEAYYRKATEVHEQVLPKEQIWRAYPLRGLGKLLLERDEPLEAEAPLRESLAISLQANPPSPIVVSIIRCELGSALLAQRRFNEAETLLLEALSTSEESPRHQDHLRQVLTHLATLYEAQRDPQKAATYRERLAALAQEPVAATPAQR